MANKQRVSMTEEQLQEHYRSQAEERRKRGLVDYTRKARKEAVEGRTPGESELSSGHRGTQATYPKPEAPRKRSRR